MISLMITLAWMALGVVLSMFWRQPGESRFAWAPIAIFLGPMWALVAIERHDDHVLRRPVK